MYRTRHILLKAFLVLVFVFTFTNTSQAETFFQKNLQRGDSGQEVVKLQQFLTIHGVTVPDTGYYGSKTLQAVKKFQELNKIQSTGNFFSLTRKFVNSVLTSNKYKIGGTVISNSGAVLLTEKSGETIKVEAGNKNSFIFSHDFSSGEKYEVTATSLSQTSQVCYILNNGVGVIKDKSITNIQVQCTPIVLGSASVASTIPPVIPRVSISIANSSANEDGGALVYTVTLDQATSVSTSVNFSISGTATPGSDFTAITSPLVIPAGQTTGTITIRPTVDTNVENDETVKITLRSGTGYTLSSSVSVTGNILNDDAFGDRVVYYKQESGDILYSNNGSDWMAVVFPVMIYNIDPSTTLNVRFITDFNLSNTNYYFIAASDNITFGNPTLTSTGSSTIFTITDVLDYPGLFQNGSSLQNGRSNIKIRNISVNSVGSELSAGGWVAQSNFGKGAEGSEISNCSSNGSVSNTSGGIVGMFSENLTISKVFSTGNISTYAGGIVGGYASNVTVSDSYSTGEISLFAGGIFGRSASYSTAVNVYSTGNISNSGGGIFGNSSSYSSAIGCYTTGSISNLAGGVFGQAYANATAQNCYTTGTSLDSGSGGIYSFSSSDGASNYSEANNSGFGWSDVNALRALVMGTNWVSTAANIPFKLANMSTSAYSIFSNDFSQTIEKGGSTISALPTYSNFSIVSINSLSPSTYTGISINSSTGVISTTSTISSGTYDIVVYSNNSWGGYNISTFHLTVND